MKNTPNPTQSPSLMPLIYLLLAVTALTAGIIYTGWLLYQNADSIKSDIPPAGPKATLPENNLANLVATALHHSNTPDITHSITLTNTDNSPFKENFANIAAHRGWLVHYSKPWQFHIFMPETDAHQLEPLILDPVTWTLNNLQQQAKPTPPDNPKLINVLITIEKTWGRGDYLHFITAVTWSIACLTAALAMAILFSIMNEALEKARTRNPVN